MTKCEQLFRLGGWVYGSSREYSLSCSVHLNIFISNKEGLSEMVYHLQVSVTPAGCSRGDSGTPRGAHCPLRAPGWAW